MTKRVGRVARCYRCVYTWRVRLRRKPRMCPRCKSHLYDVPKIRPVVLGNGLGIEEIIGPHRKRLLRIARRYGARRLFVFGSVRRREATDRSDIDLLVEWTRIPSILDHAAMAEGIEKIVGHPVDLVNRGDIHWAAEPQVEAEAVSV